MLRISKGKVPGDILFFIVGGIIAAVIVGIGVLIGRNITLICELLLWLLIRLTIVHRRLLCILLTVIHGRLLCVLLTVIHGRLLLILLTIIHGRLLYILIAVLLRSIIAVLIAILLIVSLSAS